LITVAHSFSKLHVLRTLCRSSLVLCWS